MSKKTNTLRIIGNIALIVGIVATVLGSSNMVIVTVLRNVPQTEESLPMMIAAANITAVLTWVGIPLLITGIALKIVANVLRKKELANPEPKKPIENEPEPQKPIENEPEVEQPEPEQPEPTAFALVEPVYDENGNLAKPELDETANKYARARQLFDHISRKFEGESKEENVAKTKAYVMEQYEKTGDIYYLEQILGWWSTFGIPFQEAMALAQKGMELGSPEAAMWIARRYHWGDDIPKDEKKAVAIARSVLPESGKFDYKKHPEFYLIAAEAKRFIKEIEPGDLFAPADAFGKEIWAILQKGVDANSPACAFRLGEMLLNGYEANIGIHYQEAIDNLYKAIEWGSFDAMKKIADLAATGLHTDKPTKFDYEKDVPYAIMLYYNAARLGSDIAWHELEELVKKEAQ